MCFHRYMYILYILWFHNYYILLAQLHTTVDQHPVRIIAIAA